jgi:hypothetical protein
LCQTSRAPPPDIVVAQARPSFHSRSHPLSPFFSLIFGRCLPCVRRAGRPHPPPLEQHNAAAGCRGVRSGPVCPRQPPSACMRRRPPSARNDDDRVVAACSFATKSTIIGVKSSFTTVESSFRATESSFLAAKPASAAVDSRRAATGSSCGAMQEESVVDRAGDEEGGCGAGGDDDCRPWSSTLPFWIRASPVSLSPAALQSFSHSAGSRCRGSAGSSWWGKSVAGSRPPSFGGDGLHSPVPRVCAEPRGTGRGRRQT